MSDQRDRDESAEPTEAKDPTENSEQALPIDPIESTEPFEAMERNESSERIDQRDVGNHGVVAHQGDRCGGNRGSASYSSP